MLTTLLSTAARTAVLPAATGPVGLVLLPALAYVLTNRNLSIHIDLIWTLPSR